MAEHRMEMARAGMRRAVRMARRRRNREGDGQDVEDFLMERIRARMRRVQTMVIPQMQRRMLLRIARMQMVRMVEHRMETVRVVRRLLCWI